MKKDKSLIPKGLYCYSGDYKCPYWEIIEGMHKQANGYCHFLEKGDWDLNKEYGKEVEITTFDKYKNPIKEIIYDDFDFPYSLLWDSCKECHINDDIEDEKWYTGIFGTQIRFAIDTVKEFIKSKKC